MSELSLQDLSAIGKDPEWIIFVIHPKMSMLKKISSKLVDEFSGDFMLVTANSRKNAKNLIETQLKEGNRFATILISDSFGADTTLDTIFDFSKLCPKTAFIVLREDREIPISHFMKADVNIARLLEMPFDEYDLRKAIRVLCENIDLQDQVDGFRETLEAMYEQMEERIEAGINDATGRRDFLAAVVQSRMEQLRTTLFDAQFHLPALSEMIEFTDSIKPQMSANDKKKIGPRLVNMRSAIENFGELNKKLIDLFEVSATEFSIKRMTMHYFMRRWQALKKINVEIEEEIASEIRIDADEAMFTSIFRYLMFFFLDNLPKDQRNSNILLKAYPEGIHVNFELIGRGFSTSEDQVRIWLDSNGKKNHELCLPTGLNEETINEFMRLNQSHFSWVCIKDTVHFSLSVPASKTYLTLLASLEHAEAAIDLSHVKVLLVENNDIQMLMMVKKLTHYGLDINVCASGYDALELVKTNIYDYIFINIGMDGLDGYKTSEMASDIQRRRGADPQIVLMAVGYEEINKKRMKEVNAERIVTKPISPEIIKEIFWTKIAFQASDEEKEALTDKGIP